MTRLAFDTFRKSGIVERFNGTLLLHNREKHQAEDSLKEIQDQTAARVGSEV